MERDIDSDPTPKLAHYRDRIVVAPGGLETINQTLFNWIRAASAEAYAIVIPYGEFEAGLGYPSFYVPLGDTVASCRYVTISFAALRRLDQALPQNSTGSALLLHDGISPLEATYTATWFYAVTILTTMFSCSVVGVGAIKIWYYFRGTRTCMPTIATICLWLESIAAFIRFLYWGLDPMSSRRVIILVGWQALFRTATLPFTISSTLLLTLYWHETLSKTSLKISMNLSRFKIPAILMTAVAFILEIIAWMYWGLATSNIASGLKIINQIYAIAVAFIMAAFYIITGCRILRALHGHGRSTTTHRSSTNTSQLGEPSKHAKKARERKRRAHLRSVSIRLVVSGLALVVICIVAPFIVAPAFGGGLMSSHPAFLWFWLILHNVMNVKGLSTILAFQAPKANAKTVKTSTNSSDTGTRIHSSKQISVSV